MKIAILTYAPPSRDLIAATKILNKTDYVTLYAPKGSNLDREQYIYPKPDALLQYALEAYDIVIHWVEDFAKFKQECQITHNSNFLGRQEYLFALFDKDPEVYPPMMFLNALGMIVNKAELGAALDGLTLGEVTVVETADATALAAAISNAAELALARRPYVQLSNPLSRLFTNEIMQNPEIADRIADYAFELFDLA